MKELDLSDIAPAVSALFFKNLVVLRDNILQVSQEMTAPQSAPMF
jgi:hypothetical protein